jgi:hypothetical protein
VAEEIGYENTSFHKCLPVRDDTILLPLAEVVYTRQEVSVTILTVQKAPCDVDCNPLEWCITALVFGFQHRCFIAGTSCNSAPCMKLVVSLSDLVQSFVDAELFS